MTKEKVMKVYVVLREYKDSSGCSWPSKVFSTYEKAEAFIKMQEELVKPRGYFWEIDSFEVDSIETYEDNR